MAIVLVNPGGNTPQGFADANGDTFTFAPAPEPGPRHADGVVLLFSSLPAVQHEHPAARVILGRSSGTEAVGGLGPEVSDFAHQFLGGPDTTPGIGSAVSEFVQSNPNEVPGFGIELSEFVHGLLGGPDTTPAGGRALSEFVHDLMETRWADIMALNRPSSDWPLS